jgi:hypothetical protein
MGFLSPRQHARSQHHQHMAYERRPGNSRPGRQRHALAIASNERRGRFVGAGVGSEPTPADADRVLGDWKSVLRRFFFSFLFTFVQWKKTMARGPMGDLSSVVTDMDIMMDDGVGRILSRGGGILFFSISGGQEQRMVERVFIE